MSSTTLAEHRPLIVFLNLLAFAFLASGAWLLHVHRTILATWRRVEAESVRTEVVEFRGRRQPMYRGEVEFRYVVDGAEHVVLYSFRTATSSRASVARSLEPYAPGTRHAVHHEPDDPWDMRIDVAHTFEFFLLPIAFGGVGLVLMPATVWLARRAWRERIPRCAACGVRVASNHRFCAACGADRPVVAAEDGRGSKRKKSSAKARADGASDVLALRLVGGAFLVVGTALLVGGILWGAKRWTVLRDWPTTEGTVVRSEVLRSHDLEGELQFQLRVEVEHTVDGQPLRSTAETEVPVANHASIRRTQRRYVPGSVHALRRDPSDAGWLLLEPDEDPVRFWIPAIALGGFGALFAAIGAAAALPTLRRIVRCADCARIVPRRARFCPACGASQTVSETGVGDA